MLLKMLGQRLKALRQQRSLKQATLAKRVGVTQPYIVALEKGRENPTLSTLARLADVLGVGITDFFPTGGHNMAKLTTQEHKWNDEVKKMAEKLEEVEEWALDLEKWGVKNSDWYSARGAARLAGLLHQAIAEAYDMQYFSKDDEVANWRKTHCVD